MESFIQQALVFIGASVLLVPLFQRLRLGSVLGYLMAGILVGPQGLGLIRDSSAVIHFSELGVVLLLFLIGLEIQPRRLWSMRKALIGLGGVQMLATTLVFGALAYVAGLAPLAAGTVGFAFSLSSTAFAMQTLMERNQFNTEYGRSSFAILLMQDLLAIPALALLPFLAARGSEQNISFTTLLLLLALIAFLFVSSRLLIRPLLRLVASTRSREIFIALAFFIVLGVAALMQKLHLTAALGTFMAGVLLADSEYRHELEANLEPFKGLLMGLFFIGVGMSVSVPLLLSKPALLLGITLAYLLIKTLVIYGVGRLFKMHHGNAKLTALTISQGGEFAFVILGTAPHFALLEATQIDYLTATITLSMALSPVLALLSERISCRGQAPVYDDIKNEHPQVIVAGFGRFGQIFARILNAQGIPFIAIDQDAEQVEQARRFGNKVYYGDVSRKDLLDSAGAAQAKYFVLAIDDVESSLQSARLVKKYFPHLKIFARARNRGHVYDLMEIGAEHIKRETLDSSIDFVRELLIEMGTNPKRAKSVAESFRTHDQLLLEKQYHIRNDDKELISVSKQGVLQLAQVLSEEGTQSYIEPKIESKNEMPV